jgi:hypothetical protein
MGQPFSHVVDQRATLQQLGAGPDQDFFPNGDLHEAKNRRTGQSTFWHTAGQLACHSKVTKLLLGCKAQKCTAAEPAGTGLYLSHMLQELWQQLHARNLCDGVHKEVCNRLPGHNNILAPLVCCSALLCTGWVVLLLTL